MWTMDYFTQNFQFFENEPESIFITLKIQLFIRTDAVIMKHIMAQENESGRDKN